MMATIPALIAAMILWLIQQVARGPVLFPPEIARAFKQAEVTLVKWEAVADAALTWWWVPVLLLIALLFRSRQ